VHESLYNRGVKTVLPPGDAPIQTQPCPVCGQTGARPTFAIEGLEARVVTCVGCGLGSIFPQPDAATIAGFYPPEYYGHTGAKFEPLVESLVRLVAARHVRFLARRLPRGGRVLDLGCGRGVLLATFANMGFEVHGVEVSETAAQGADPRVELRFASRLADAQYPAEFFDQIVIWHVLEHVPDPRETLQEAHRILKPGGRVVVAVPNFSSWQARWAGPAWFHLDLPRHLFHFPVEALRSLLENCGLECLSEHHFSLRQNPFGWVQSLLNKSHSWPRNALYTMLQRGHEQERPTLDRRTRLKLRAAYCLGMPPALALSMVAAAFRRGATVHVVARRR
jgi:SAM-dependent methyltransferase